MVSPRSAFGRVWRPGNRSDSLQGEREPKRIKGEVDTRGQMSSYGEGATRRVSRKCLDRSEDAWGGGGGKEERALKRTSSSLRASSIGLSGALGRGFDGPAAAEEPREDGPASPPLACCSPGGGCCASAAVSPLLLRDCPSPSSSSRTSQSPLPHRKVDGRPHCKRGEGVEDAFIGHTLAFAVHELIELWRH